MVSVLVEGVTRVGLGNQEFVPGGTNFGGSIFTVTGHRGGPLVTKIQ